MQEETAAFTACKNQFQGFLGKRNLKMTRQRFLILQEFLCQDGHVSAEELYFNLHLTNPSIGQATVFRNLKLLAEAGIAEEVRLDSRTVRYEYVRRGTHHDHFRCLTCRTVIEFNDPALEAAQDAVAQRLGLELTGHRLELFGYCQTCKTKP